MKNELPRPSAWRLFLITFAAVCLLWVIYGWRYYQNRAELANEIETLENLQAVDPDLAQTKAREIRAKAIQNGDDLALGQAYYYLARMDRDANRFSSLYSQRAMRLAEVSHEYLQKTGDRFWIARSYGLLTQIQSFQLTDPDSSIRKAAYQEHLNHLNVFQEVVGAIKDSRESAMLQATYQKVRAIGTKLAFHKRRDSLAVAAFYLDSALKQYKEVSEFEEMAISARALSDTYVDIALNHLLVKDSIQALIYLEKAERYLPIAIDHFTRASDSVGLSNVLGKKAEITEGLYRAKGDPALLDSAIQEYTFVYENFPQASQAQLHYRIARLLFASVFYSDGMDEGEKVTHYYEARERYVRAAKIAFENLDINTLNVVLEDWERTGQIDDTATQAMQALSRNLVQLAKTASEKEAAVQLEIRKSERAESLQREKAQQRSLIFIGVSVLALLIAGAVTYFQQRNVIRLKEQLIQKIRLAQTRMNPHFIGNTLNALDNLIIQKRNVEASTYLVRFSRMAKDTFHLVDRASIPLEEEHKLLENYLSLEKLRVGEDFHYEIRIAPNLDKRKIELPPMLMQPLVENAIWHGIQPNLIAGKKKGILTISFTGSPTDDSPSLLICTVEDNGIGRQNAKKLQIDHSDRPRETSSTKVILERLELIGHERAKLSVKDLTDSNNQPTGTRFTLHIPLNS